ncbi:MAG: hypothetical protein D6732_16040 [Methanobacteriota archaeon]|nr:MAG: hypothetical protein D6732_16040 [Euryarchaeota archaeon]
MTSTLLKDLTLESLGAKHVLTIGLDGTVDNAITLMKDFDTFVIPVIHGSEFLGIIDGMAILEEFHRNPYSATLYTKIEDLKIKEIESFPKDLSIKDAVEVLLSLQSCLPVMEKDILYSLITPNDLVSYNFIWTGIDEEILTGEERIFDYRSLPHLKISEDSSLLNLISHMSTQNLEYLVLIEPDTKLWKGVISVREVILEIFKQTQFSDINEDFLYRTGLFSIIHHPNLYFSSPPKIRNIRFVMNEYNLSVVPLVDIDGTLIDIIDSRKLLNKLFE